MPLRWAAFLSLVVLLASGCGGSGESGELASVEAEIALRGAGQVAAGGDYVWATSGDGSLSRIDPIPMRSTQR